MQNVEQVEEQVNPEAETEEVESVPEAEVENESAQEEAIDLSPEEQEKFDKLLAKERKKFGNAIAAERAKARQKGQEALMNEPAYQQQPSAPEGAIYDPETGEYVDVNSVTGQLLQRAQKVSERKAQEQQAQAFAAQQKQYEELVDRINVGYGTHDNFDQALQIFTQNGTDAMAEALQGVDEPSELIAYYADKPGELQRIAKLPPAKQVREIHRAEDTIKPRKKLVNKASEPVSGVNSNRNLAVRSNDQSYEQMCAYWKERLNSR